MLKTLKNNKKSSKLFYGINSGNYGFLMNKFSKKLLIKNINKSNLIKISPLEMLVLSKSKSRKCLAINDPKEKPTKWIFIISSSLIRLSSCFIKSLKFNCFFSKGVFPCPIKS